MTSGARLPEREHSGTLPSEDEGACELYCGSVIQRWVMSCNTNKYKTRGNKTQINNKRACKLLRMFMFNVQLAASGKEKLISLRQAAREDLR